MTTYFTKPDKPLAEMSVDELSALKVKWYSEARAQGLLERIKKVCRELGERIPARYGPKYGLQLESVHVYVDGYGGYMTVHRGQRFGKQIVSTHADPHGLFVPGDWLDEVEALHDRAAESQRQRKVRKDESDRQKLTEQLSG